MTIALCNIIKKVAFFVVFLGLILPYSALSMQNAPLSPCTCIRLTIPGRSSSVLIKNNTFALKEPGSVRIWNLEKLSVKNRIPCHEYTFSKIKDEYDSMDLDDSGTKLLLQHQKLYQYGWNDISLYDLSTNSCFCLFEANTDDGIKLKNIANSSLTRKQATRFFDANTVVKAAGNAIHIVKSPEQPTEKIELISINMPMDSFMKSMAGFEDPIIAVDQVGKKFAYFRDGTYFSRGEYISKSYLFTNHNYRHSWFVFLMLKQLSLPKDVVCEIVSRMQFSVVQQINTEKIKNDPILWIEYSPDGSTIALTGWIYNYLCKPQEADRENKNCITTISASGFSIFHPNNKTFFVMVNDGRTLLGIDIKTNKIIYEYLFMVKVGMDVAREEQNQALAFNKKGDKLAVVFYDYCQIYDVPERLQNFLKTYDPETVSAIIAEP